MGNGLGQTGGFEVVPATTLTFVVPALTFACFPAANSYIVSFDFFLSLKLPKVCCSLVLKYARRRFASNGVDLNKDLDVINLRSVKVSFYSKI